MKTRLFLIVTSFFYFGCSTPTVNKPLKIDSKFAKLEDKDMDISYSVASASSDSIYMLVKIKNISMNTLLLDPSLFTLKNEKNEKLASSDPEVLTRTLKREAQLANEEKANSAAKDSEGYVSRNFLKRTLIKPGEEKAGYVLFYTENPVGKWALITKLSEKRLSSNQNWFEIKR